MRGVIKGDTRRQLTWQGALVVLGHSMGGVIALEALRMLGSRRPAPVLALLGIAKCSHTGVM